VPVQKENKKFTIHHPTPDFAIPFNLTQEKMAKDINVGIKTISELYNEKRGVTPVMALKLSEYFGTTPEFWLNLQTAYDLYKAYEKNSDEVKAIRQLDVA